MTRTAPTGRSERYRPGPLWVHALGRGCVAFVIVAGVGQLLAFAGLVLADVGASFWTMVRIGAVYLGAFHHVAVELDLPDLHVTAVPAAGATSVSIGVALLSVTALGLWLVFRAGREVAGRGGGPMVQRTVLGAAVAPGYAAPAFVAMALADTGTPLRIGAFASGRLEIALSTWQAALFPLFLAVAAGAAGGACSALAARTDRRGRLARAMVAGGRRMFVSALALSVAGLFVAGVVQPDGPAALLTPSTARYLRAVADRPGAGVVTLVHHVAAAPNEAMWALVPAMGGSVGVRGSASSDLLRYGRFPTEVNTVAVPIAAGHAVRLPVGGATFGPAPPAYLLFLLAPALSVWLGGRRAGERSGETGPAAMLAGAGAGLVFAALVGMASVLSSLTLGYGAAFGADGTSGWVIAGPNAAVAAALGAAWGVVGGAAGAWTAAVRARPRTSSPRPAGAAPR